MSDYSRVHQECIRLGFTPNDEGVFHDWDVYEVLSQCERRSEKVEDKSKSKLKKEIVELKARVKALEGLVSDKPDGSIEINIPSIKADAIRAIEEKVYDGDIKVVLDGRAPLCAWVADGVWLLEQADKLEAGTL